MVGVELRRRGGTLDHWDVAAIPDGAHFGIRFDAYTLPDEFRIAYRGTTALDTGWRGSSDYQGDAAYPGGIAGPGSGEQLDLFVKSGTTTFTVTVIGVDDDTEWTYNVRCRMP